MDEKEKLQVDELLSGYLDGELSKRQYTQIKRLIKNDQQVAARLGELERCRQLLGALPVEAAPEGISRGVMESLSAARLVVEERTGRRQHRAGVRDLFVRRLVAAAAMVAVIVLLGAVVFNILRPRAGQDELAAGGDMEPKAVIDNSYIPRTGSITKVVLSQQPFQMRLELTSRESFSVNAVVAKAIYDNGLLDCSSIRRENDKAIYTLRCGKENIGVLVASLRNIWPKFDHTRMAVSKESFGEALWVDDVSAEQVLAILRVDDSATRLAMARDFAVLNRISSALADADGLAGVGSGDYEFLNVDKPVLTWGRPARAKTQDEIDGSQVRTELTIVVTSKIN